MSNTKQPTPLGGVIFADTPIEFNTGKPETKIKVRNTGIVLFRSVRIFTSLK